MRRIPGLQILIVTAIATVLFASVVFVASPEITIQESIRLVFEITGALVILVLLLVTYSLRKQRGRPLNLQKEGKYSVLKSISPESRKTGNELWRLLVVGEKKKNILLLGYPYSWLDVRGNTSRDRLEISKVEGRYLFNLYLTSVPSLPGIPTPDLEDFEAETGEEP